MKILLLLAVMFSSAALCAQGLPAHCVEAKYRDQLRAIGPMVSVGASTSSGMLAKSFPLVAANQLCLTQASGYASLHTFSSSSKFPFLKKAFIELRPKVIVALDHLHHSSKRRRFDAETRKYLDAEIAMLTLDCKHPLIDCSSKGDFHFVEKENYRPVVLLGDIHAFYAVDCSKTDPFAVADSADPDVGCLDDYRNMNQYLRQKAKEIPNLFIFPVDDFYRNLHRGLPFVYQIDGKLGNFYTKDIFWDSFHPWSEPGTQIMANLVLAKLNELIKAGSLRATVPIPYIKIDENYFKPYTGIALIGDTGFDMPRPKNLRLVTPQGETFSPVFADQTKSFRASNGDWEYVNKFENDAKPTIAGINPLVIKIEGVAENGDIVIAGDQLTLLKQVTDDARNQLLGGIVTTTH